MQRKPNLLSTRSKVELSLNDRWRITGSRAKEECEASTAWCTRWYISRMGLSRVPSITRAMSTCRDCQFVMLRATSIFVHVRLPSATGFFPFLPRLFHENVDSEAWRRNSRNVLARRPPRKLRESTAFHSQLPLLSLDLRFPRPFPFNIDSLTHSISIPEPRSNFPPFFFALIFFESIFLRNR